MLHTDMFVRDEFESRMYGETVMVAKRMSRVKYATVEQAVEEIEERFEVKREQLVETNDTYESTEDVLLHYVDGVAFTLAMKRNGNTYWEVALD